MKRKVLAFILMFLCLAPLIIIASNIDSAKEKELLKISKVKVAIIDSGINAEYLNFPIKDEFNAVNPTKSTFDDMSHGTPIASIISSSEIDLYDVQVLNKDGKGKPEHLVKAIEWCIEKKINIINLSFGYQTESQKVKEIIDKAVAEGILIIAAAGNTYGFGVDYPAKYENVLSITAVNSNSSRLPSSGKGKIDFSFEGEEVIGLDKNGIADLYTGTSFATANATKYIADIMVKLKKPLDKENIVSILKKDSIDLGEKGYDPEYGNGYIKNKN